MTSWQKVKLGDKDITTLIGDGLHGTPVYSKDGEYAFINGNNLISGYIVIKSDTKMVNLSEYLKYKKDLDYNTLFVSINGTLGNVAEYNNEKIILGKSACYLNISPAVEKKFIKYVLLSPLFQDYLQNNATGTTIKNVSLKQIRDYSFNLPPLDVQKKIAGVLGALDDKIELNNRINNNLEQQAQALFKSWFVDFEPFGGKMPDDWKVGKLEDVADFTNGYAFKSNELEDDPISGKDYYDVFKQGHIMRGGRLNLTGTKSYYPKDKAEKLGKYVLRKGDILMAMTDMKGNVAILGNTALMNIDDKYILNQRVGLLRCNNEYAISYPYVYILTNSFDFLKDLRNRANSGVQVNLSSAEIKNSDVIIPSRDINQGFNKIGEAIFEKIFANQQENIQLSVLRDTLLPKLMSGEIDVDKVNIKELKI